MVIINYQYLFEYYNIMLVPFWLSLKTIKFNVVFFRFRESLFAFKQIHLTVCTSQNLTYLKESPDIYMA